MQATSLPSQLGSVATAPRDKGPAAAWSPHDLIDTLGPMGRAGRAWVAALLAVCLVGFTAYVYQLRRGLAATAMTDYFSWGIYIVNFVFFIGISMAGTLISALLRLSGAEWRRPVTRLAEAITLFSLLIAGPMIIVDMGRPDRFFHVLWYGRLQSPILWDVLSLITYLAGSVLYLYLPMIPDLAILRDSGRPFAPWRQRLYRVLAIGWRSSAEQHRLLERGIAITAIAIIPVAVSIHTVTAWLFGMTLRPGWHSTIIGPDFVVGALYSGIAAVIAAIALFRHCFALHRWLTAEHFLKLARLMFVFGVVYAYFLLNEHVGQHYTNEGRERRLMELMMHGQYAALFWVMVIIGLLLPLFLLVLPWARSVGGVVTAAVLVNVGMWLKRYIIVVPTLAAPLMPTAGLQKLSYMPTFVEWAVTAGGFAAFALLYTVFAKLFPIVSIWETSETAATGNSASAAAAH